MTSGKIKYKKPLPKNIRVLQFYAREELVIGREHVMLSYFIF
jgi:hypothetical protein